MSTNCGTSLRRAHPCCADARTRHRCDARFRVAVAWSGSPGCVHRDPEIAPKNRSDYFPGIGSAGNRSDYFSRANDSWAFWWYSTSRDREAFPCVPSCSSSLLLTARGQTARRCGEQYYPQHRGRFAAQQQDMRRFYGYAHEQRGRGARHTRACRGLGPDRRHRSVAAYPQSTHRIAGASRTSRRRVVRSRASTLAAPDLRREVIAA
jgi:hypothetical protein